MVSACVVADVAYVQVIHPRLGTRADGDVFPVPGLCARDGVHGQQVALVTATPNGGREAAVVPSVGRGVPTVVTSGAEAWRVKWMRGGLLLVSGWEGAGKGLSLRAVDPTRKTTVDSFPAIALGTDMISAGFDITRDGKYLALVRGRGDGRIGVLEAKSGKF